MTAHRSQGQPDMFVQLLDNPSGRNPGDIQNDAARHFPQVTDSSPLKLRQAGASIPEATYLILGVASYARAELELLDEIVANADRWVERITIYVFDVAACATLDGVHQRLNPRGSNSAGTRIVQTAHLAGRAA